MKIAVIAYDLEAVEPDHNQCVKEALLSFTNTYAGLQGFNILSPFLQHIVLRMPDTTVTAQVVGTVSPKEIADDVIAVIREVGANPDKVYVAFIEDEYLWNSKP